MDSLHKTYHTRKSLQSRQRHDDGEVAGQSWVHSIADPPGYVEEHVWPAYLRDKAALEQEGFTSMCTTLQQVMCSCPDNKCTHTHTAQY